jgi:hypothetical protein
MLAEFNSFRIHKRDEPAVRWPASGRVLEPISEQSGLDQGSSGIDRFCSEPHRAAGIGIRFLPRF